MKKFLYKISAVILFISLSITAKGASYNSGVKITPPVGGDILPGSLSESTDIKESII